MTDRDDVIFISTADAVADTLERIGQSPHTRFPVIGKLPTDFRGIVYVPSVLDNIDDLRRGETTFEEIAAPPMTMRADTPISEAVDAFQSQNQELALVTDEDGDRILGLITATDALEAVMGKIEDPIDIELSNRLSETG